MAVIGYALLKDTDRTVSVRWSRAAIAFSIAGQIALVAGLFWFVTRYERLLPITFVDVRPISFFRQIVGGVAVLVLGCIAMGLLWVRRRSLLDQWLIVALCALLIEVILASVLSGARYNLAWYAGRFYQLVTATVVMVVLLAEMTRLYASIAHSNTMLHRERLMLKRAVDAQRREREARLITGDAVAAAIAHEVKQPLSAMITRSETGLRWLDRAMPDLEKAKTALRQIAADGYRAGAVIESVRANFKKEARITASLDVGDLVQEAIALVRGDLQANGIVLKTEANGRVPRVLGDRIQLQQVLLNLITNAIESMSAKDGPRILSVTSGVHEDGDVVVSVGDTGAGISPQDVERVFSPLFTTKSDGMGMGLSICRSIIEAHDGHLWVVPNTPAGAVFQFVLRADSGTATGVASPRQA